ncbi:hypothetical protein LCGC14_2696390, partial [marine sediment metagenome]
MLPLRFGPVESDQGRIRGRAPSRACSSGRTGTDQVAARLPGRLLAAVAVATALLALALFTTPPSQAAFPGDNGKIAFQTDRDGKDEIYFMNADGSGQT